MTQEKSADDEVLQLLIALRCLHEAMTARNSAQRLATMGVKNILDGAIERTQLLQREIKTAHNVVAMLTEAECQAVAAYLPYKTENERLRTLNMNIESRNSMLESVLSDMRNSARAVLAIEPAA